MLQSTTAVPGVSLWSSSHKITFRAGFLFFLQYMLLGSNEIFADETYLYGYYIRPFYQLIPWIGKHILHLSYPITVFPDGGSSDTTFDYVLILFMLAMAAMGTVIWSVLDRHRSDYQRLNYWLSLALRYYCAYTMLSFGLDKIFKLQFPYPSSRTLLEPVGNFSPMRLAWTFFGYSGLYTHITGWAEFISGILLLHRRTHRLGTLFFLVVIFNVACINYSYDICLKTTSTILFLMGIYLLAPDLKRLGHFFILNTPVSPANDRIPRLPKRWMRISLLFLKYALTITIILNCFWVVIIPYGFNAPPLSYLNGAFEVQDFVRGHDTIPPLLTDSTRWRRLILVHRTPDLPYGVVTKMNDKGRSYYTRTDTVGRTISFYNIADTTLKYHLSYTRIGKDSLLLKGSWEGESLSLILKKQDPNATQLMSRGFHWINEIPYVK